MVLGKLQYCLRSLSRRVRREEGGKERGKVFFSFWQVCLDLSIICKACPPHPFFSVLGVFFSFQFCILVSTLKKKHCVGNAAHKTNKK